MVTRVLRRRLGIWIDPETVHDRLVAGAPRSFWLDCGPDAGTGVSAMGVCSAEGEIVVRLPSVADAGTGAVRSAADAVFDLIDDALAAVAADVDVDADVDLDQGRHRGATGAEADPLAAAFAPGLVGWIGYEVGAAASGVPVHASRVPDVHLLRADAAILIDHAHREIALVALDTADGRAWMDRTEAALGSFVAPAPAPAPAASAAPVGPPSSPPPPARTSGGLRPRWRHSADRYLDLVEECRAAIHEGDAYQLCLTNAVDVDGDIDPLEAYRRLRRASPSHHGGLVVADGVALLSSSPERFLHVDAGRTVSTTPIKGTRPRAADAAEDARLATELVESVKERAENVMIVDLMRNDLARVATLGSVRVPTLLAVESYPPVHQLVSTIEAELAEGITAGGLLRAVFPAGSMTGAPKHSAMSILQRLERGPRGPYAGAFGYLAFDGRMDLAVVIRSIVVDRLGAVLGTGGGITALSVAEEELEETRVKARALLAALEAPLG